jgi:hypothetical protein
MYRYQCIIYNALMSNAAAAIVGAALDAEVLFGKEIACAGWQLAGVGGANHMQVHRRRETRGVIMIMMMMMMMFIRYYMTIHGLVGIRSLEYRLLGSLAIQFWIHRL